MSRIWWWIAGVLGAFAAVLSWWKLGSHVTPAPTVVSALVSVEPGQMSLWRAVLDLPDGSTRDARRFDSEVERDTFWTFEVSKLPSPDRPDAEVVLKGASSGWGSFPLAQLARASPGWSAIEMKGIPKASTRTDGAPLRSGARGPYLWVSFEEGPDAGRVRVRVGDQMQDVDLSAPSSGWRSLHFGTHTRLWGIEVPGDIPAGTVIRIVPQSGAARIEVQRTSRSCQFAHVGPDAVRITPRPSTAPRTLAALGIGLWIFFAVLLEARHRLRTPGAGVAYQRVVLWSLGITGLTLLLWFPGIEHRDAITRIIPASFLATGGEIPESRKNHWFAPGQSLAIAASLRLTGSIWLHTLAMTMCFWLSLGVLLVLVATKRVGVAVFGVLMLVPQIVTHSATVIPDTWTAAALQTIAAACVFAWRTRREQARGERSKPSARAWVLATASFSLACVVLCTFRANAIALVPLVGVLILLCVRPWRRALAWGGALLAGVWLWWGVPRWMPWERLDTASASLAWEHVGMLNLVKDEPDFEQVLKAHSLDHICRPGKTTRDLALDHRWTAHDWMFWEDDPEAFVYPVVKPSNDTKARWWALVRERPDLYIRAKLRIWASMLCFVDEVPFPFGYQPRQPRELAYGIDLRPTPLLGNAGMELIGWLTHHRAALEPISWLWLWLLSVPAVLWLLLRRGMLKVPALILLALALAYLGTFLLISPGLHLRYVLPTWTLIIAFLAHACHAMFEARGIATGQGEAGG